MTLYAHQQNIVNNNPWRVGLFLGTGSGKTRTAVVLTNGVVSSVSEAKGHTLVVCKKTQTLDGTWTDEWEYQKKDPELLTVISKEQLKMEKNAGVFERDKWDSIIGDEAHTLAGVLPSTFQLHYKKYPKTSATYQAMKRLIDHNPGARVYLLTATPSPQPMTVYGLGTLLGYNWDFNDFRDAFYFEKTRGVWLSKTKTASVNANMSKVLLQNPDWAAVVNGRMNKDQRWQLAKNISAHAKRRLANIINNIGYVGRLEDWFDVPEQIYKVETVDNTLGQRQCYQELRLLYPDPLVQLGKRRQLEQGVFEGTTVSENKTPIIEQYMDEYGKVAAFCKYRLQIDLYREKLEKRGYTVYVLDGRTKDQGVTVTQAVESESCVLLIQNQISEGYQLINEHDSDAVKDFKCVMFMTPDTYKDFDQGQGRVQRVNRIKRNLYVFVVGGEADKQAHVNVIDGEDFNEVIHAERLSRSKQL